MKIKDLSSFKKDEVTTLLSHIPFYRELQLSSQKQLEKILSFSCIVELEPGEVIMRRGDKGSWLYFLIKGRLSVYLDHTSAEKPLNHITPGELFGDLALLCNHERKATVAADPDSRKVLLFATDFKPFGEVDNFTTVDLDTKLIFYRTMVHSIRWRLEVNRMTHPSHPLEDELRQVPLINAAKGSREELLQLHKQAQFLARVLDKWNSGAAGEVVGDVMVASTTNQS